MKLKREIAATDTSDVPIDHPRTKRRKRGSSVASHSVAEDAEMANASSSDVALEGKQEKESVRELGLKVWHAVRNAKGKE